MGKKELKQMNSDLEIHVVDLISKFDPSKSNKFTKFLIKKLRDSWDEPRAEKMSINDFNDGYTIPKSINRVEQQIIYYLNEVFGEENIKALYSLHNHMENNRVEGEKDINQFKSWDEIQRVNALATIKYEQKKLEKEVMKVIETDEWLVIRPLTFQSSLTYGAGTRWCTASRNNREYFYKYSRNGVLVYVINKKDGDKYGIFRDIRNNGGEFSIWNAPDIRIDSIESSIPGDLMKTIYQYMKDTQDNYHYFSDEEKKRSDDYYGKSILQEATEQPILANNYRQDVTIEMTDEVGMDEEIVISGETGEDLIVVWRGNMEGVERVYEYVENEREEPSRDPWVGVPQTGEFGGEENERGN